MNMGSDSASICASMAARMAASASSLTAWPRAAAAARLTMEMTPANWVPPMTADRAAAPQADDRLDVLCQHLLLDTPTGEAVLQPLTWAQTLLPDHHLQITDQASDQAESLTGPGGSGLAALQAAGPPLTVAQRQILRGAAQARRLHPTPQLEGQLHHVRVDFGFVELGVEEHARLQR